MGNMFAEQNNSKSNQKTNGSNEHTYNEQYTNLNLVEKLAKAAASPTTASSQMPVNPKTPKEKCDEIADELNRLQEEVHRFNGQKYDKDFLKLDELLTRCLLKLDEIDRSDENVNQQRKTLISFTHELTEHLESKCQTSTSLVPVGERSLEIAASNTNNQETYSTSHEK